MRLNSFKKYILIIAGSGVYVENRKNDTTNQPESEIGNVTEKLNKTENDSVKHQEKLLHKTTTIENEIFYKQGTSKQNDVEVNNSQHKENVPIIDQGIPGTVGNILINQVKLKQFNIEIFCLKIQSIFKISVLFFWEILRYP